MNIHSMIVLVHKYIHNDQVYQDNLLEDNIPNDMLLLFNIKTSFLPTYDNDLLVE